MTEYSLPHFNLPFEIESTKCGESASAGPTECSHCSPDQERIRSLPLVKSETPGTLTRITGMFGRNKRRVGLPAGGGPRCGVTFRIKWHGSVNIIWYAWPS